MARGRPQQADQPEVLGTGFLLSSLGLHSAQQFAAQLIPLGLTPPLVGVLWGIASGPGRSQQSIADEFGMPASRLVTFLDDLEAQGLVERRRDPRDRRMHSLHLSAAGAKLMRRIAAIGKEAQDELLRCLDPAERTRLHGLLTRVAEDQGLNPGVHPGYRTMRPSGAAADPTGCSRS